MDSVESTSSPKLHRSFTTWVEQNYAMGLDGSGNRQQYIPYARLRQYADHQRVGTFLGTEDKEVDIRKLRDDYLLIFFILVYITGPGKNWTVYFLEFYHKAYDDSRLPLPKPPDKGSPPSHDSRSPFPHTSDGISAWQEFYKHQWRFFPLRFKDSYGHRIERIHERTQPDPRHIIPVTIEEELQRNDGCSARVLKVSPQESSGLPSTPIIMKEYSRSESEYQFCQERQTYTAINNIADPQDFVDRYFLRYYGSFVQADKCVIIVEYADKKTLLDLFKGNQCLPRDELEARTLWEGLSMLCRGLEIIHRRGKNNLAIHQDIKPANVFAFSDPEEPNRLLFKLGDLGLSSIREPSGAGDAVGQDNHGSKMYSAPETCQWSEDVQGLASDVTWAVDIWSLGCLFFETAIWMAAYEQGRQEFRQARVNETENFDELVRAGYRGAFHNGFDALPTLSEKVREISNLDTPVARLSVKVMEFALNEMLVPRTKQRLNAEQLGERFRRMLNPSEPQPPVSLGVSQTTNVTQAQVLGGIKSRIGHSEVDISDEKWKPTALGRNSHDTKDMSRQTSCSGKQTGRRRSSEQGGGQKPSTSLNTASRKNISPSINASESDNSVAYPSFPLKSDRPHMLTVSEVVEWIPRAKRYKEKLDGMAAVLKVLRDRRQVFVIDNSVSMGVYWKDVKRTAHALSYLGKHFSPGGFDIHMTNSWVKTRRRKTKNLFDDNGLLERHHPRESHGPCQMESALSSILLPVVNKAAAVANKTTTHHFKYGPWKARRVQGVDVYILTNGVWEANATLGRDDEASGVENAIEAVVRRLRESGLPRTFLSIQFIRFGQDRDGARRLQWLDNGIKHRMGDWDVVDTTHNEGNVRKMLIGSKSELVDNAED
ncbi:kinase-like domain-containing protein [Xylaria acuta]|nr:kinase-like domain-containing protein [Xylaria acuta]